MEWRRLTNRYYGERRGRQSRNPALTAFGDRWHARAVGSNQNQDHVQPRRDVPRPHDRPGRGSATPEDAERDCAEYPDRGSDTYFLTGGDHATTLCSVQRRAGGVGIDSNRRGPGVVASLSDPYDYRRVAFRYRHCRYGSR